MARIEIEIDDALLFELMKRAHEADVTLNKYIEVLLTDYLDELERQEAG
jgi:Arc/MetJ family transcription regulator